MKKKRNKQLNRILAVLIIVAAVCVGGYFAFCFWVNASGMIMGKDAKVDQGSAIVVNGADRREGVFTLLICATDEEEKRTDSMMLLVFDTKNKKANILNIPRDSLVDCDRTGAGRKINAAYAYGVDEMMDEVSTVVGFRPDKYLVANFDAIAKIVDVVGGVDYDVPFDMSYHDASQDLSIEFKKGEQHLNGKQVVEYLRWRHNDDGTGYDDGWRRCAAAEQYSKDSGNRVCGDGKRQDGFVHFTDSLDRHAGHEDGHETGCQDGDAVRRLCPRQLWLGYLVLYSR